MKQIYPLLLLVCSCLEVFSQVTGTQRHYCYTDEIWSEMVKRDSSLLFARQQVDDAISKYSQNIPADQQNRNPVTRSQNANPNNVIPVAIYIVYDTSTVNISMAQIQSQMDQLNASFAPYGYQFCYAKKNVSNNTLFTPQAGDSAGVFRMQSALSRDNQYLQDAQLKALSTLPSPNYLRIFVVHSITPQGVLGYTQMPGGPAATDGIVVRSDVFGSNNYCSGCTLLQDYNLGATLTHEVGHFLDLYHTFQGSCDTGMVGNAFNCQIYGDRVCDTWPCTGHFGCPNIAPAGCDGIHNEQIENYMDYTDDPCKNSFTDGQNERMNFGTLAYHSVLISTQNLINTGISCVHLGNAYANFTSDNFQGCQNQPMTFASLGTSQVVYTWNFGDGTAGIGDTVQHIYTASGQYQVTLNAVDSVQGINVINTMPVFISYCQPINCSQNMWDGNYLSMDFSSGRAVPTNHPTLDPDLHADFYGFFYRADDNGNPLFHFESNVFHGTRFNYAPLYNSAYQLSDSLHPGFCFQFLPVKDSAGMYCVVNAIQDIDSAGYIGLADTIVYSYIKADHNTVKVVPNKRTIRVALPFNAAVLPDGNPFTSIPNCDGSKFWTIFNTRSSFVVMEVDPDTVIYHQLYTIAGFSGAYYLTASPDGRMIIATVNNFNLTHEGFYLLNFDKESGNIVSDQSINLGSYPTFADYANKYRPCFSPNSRFLYVTEPCCILPSNNTGYIYQLDVWCPQPWSSKKVIGQFARNSVAQTPMQDLQLGPDNKIYIGHFNSPGNDPRSYRLGIINYPDVEEDGTNSTGYNDNGPGIVPSGCSCHQISILGFQSIVDHNDAYGCNWHPDVPQSFSYCHSSCLTYQFSSDKCWPSYWNFGDGASGLADTSTSSTPAHTFSAYGNYTVKLVTNGDTLSKVISITGPQPLIAATPYNSCQAPVGNYSIANIQPFVKYIWTVTHGTPTTATGVTNLDVSWNAGDTTGRVQVLAIDTVSGCTNTAVLNLNLPHGGTVYTNYQAFLCGSNSYPFGNQILTTPGIYTDTVSWGVGCDSIITLTLRADNPPVVSWPGNSDTFNIQSGGIILSGGLPPGGVYAGTGVNANVFYPALANTGSNVITYTYTDSNGCGASASRTFVVDAIDNLNLQSQVVLFPDPANNMITLKSDLFATPDYNITLFDITGRLLSIPFGKFADKVVFDISSLPAAPYLFKCIVRRQQVNKRFVKM